MSTLLERVGVIPAVSCGPNISVLRSLMGWMAPGETSVGAAVDLPIAMVFSVTFGEELDAELSAR